MNFTVDEQMMKEAREKHPLATHAVFWPTGDQTYWDYDPAYGAEDAQEIADDAGKTAVIREL